MLCHPPSSTLPGLIHAYAATAGSNEALICADRRYTYEQLRDAAGVAAQGMAALGVGPGDRVAILMGNRAEWVIAAIALGALGATVVAMNTWWTAREIEYALDHSEATFLVCEAQYMRHDYARELSDLQAQGKIPLVRTIVAIGQALPGGWHAWSDVCAGKQSTELPHDSHPDHIAFILYTSGSTSLPKGVTLRQGDLVENTWHIGRRQRFSASDRLWLAVSLFWGFGCSNAMPAMLSHGGCLVLQHSFDAAAALALIESERCSVIYATPNMIHALAEHPDRARRNLSGLRTGATLGNPAQLARAAELAPEICNVYGLTEIYGNCNATSADDPLALRLASSGRPLPGVTQRIVDPTSGRILPPGEIGEIRIKGRVTPGYLKDEAQTLAAFDADGFFRTGDLGMVDDQGNLQFHGRLKELVKTGGINVSPAEIEAVLMTHPDVAHAVVTGIPDSTRDEILAAVVIPKLGASPSQDSMRQHCKAQLATYKVPAVFHFCSEDALPLTTTGKVQKNRIAEVFFSTSA